MKRTNTRRKREIQHFVSDIRRLFPFVGLFVLGVACGVGAFLSARDRFDALAPLLRVQPVDGSTVGWLSAWGSRCFGGLGLLALLYLLGLWACGAPFVLAVPLFYGMGLGLTEAYYYAMGQRGVLAVAAVILPHGLLTAAVLVTAAAESLRLSAHLSRRLLPEGAEAEGLWSHFRLYSLRYLLFLAAAAVIGALDTLLRLLFGNILP